MYFIYGGKSRKTDIIYYNELKNLKNDIGILFKEWHSIKSDLFSRNI